MKHITRHSSDRRATERRQPGRLHTEEPDNDNRYQDRRNYLDRRTDPEWRQRWLRERVKAALRG